MRSFFPRLKTESTLALACGLLAVGCSVKIDEKAGNVNKNPAILPPASPAIPVNAAMTYRMVPGKLNSATTNSGAIQGFITPTNQTTTMGSDRAIRLTIGRSKSF